MLITRNNYEEFFIDFLDGNLHPELVKEFHDFLASNPDLKAELDEMKNIDEISIQQEDDIFDRKEKLKKDEYELLPNLSADFDKYAIAYIEHDLNPEQEQEFDNYLILNTAKKKAFQLFLKTKLTADQNIQFKEKSSLKRVLVFGLSRRNFYTAISIAASFLLIFSLFQISGNGDDMENQSRFSHQQKTENVDFETVSGQLAEKPISKDKKEKKQQPESKEIFKKENLSKSKKNREAKRKSEKELNSQAPQIEPKSLKKDDFKKANKKYNAIEKELQKINPKSVKPNLKKKTSPSKRVLKPVEVHSQGLLASVSLKQKEENKYLNLRQLATRFFKKKVLKQKEEDINPDKINLWEIADAGVERINKVTKNEIDIIRKYNTEGDLIAYAYNSPNLSFRKSVKNK